jgi:hypothetical protein
VSSGGGWRLAGGELPFSGAGEPNPLFESIWTFENNFCIDVQKNFLENYDPAAWASKMVLFLRGAMRAIASLGIEGAPSP